MPNKKSNLANSKPVTQEFVAQQIDKVIDFVKQQRTLLESKIEFYRKDAKEQIQGVSVGLHKKMNKMGQRMDEIDKKHTQRIGFLNQQIENLDKSQEEKFGTVNQKLDAITQRLDSIVEKVERHEEEITFLKSTATQN